MRRQTLVSLTTKSKAFARMICQKLRRLETQKAHRLKSKSSSKFFKSKDKDKEERQKGKDCQTRLSWATSQEKDSENCQRTQMEKKHIPEFQSQLHCLRTNKHLLAPTNEYKNKSWQSIDTFVLRQQEHKLAISNLQMLSFFATNQVFQRRLWFRVSITDVSDPLLVVESFSSLWKTAKSSR
jgi:hypothetical protein